MAGPDDRHEGAKLPLSYTPKLRHHSPALFDKLRTCFHIVVPLLKPVKNSALGETLL